VSLVAWIQIELPDPNVIEDPAAWRHVALTPIYNGCKPGVKHTVHEYLRGRLTSTELEAWLDWRFGLGPHPEHA
jgi:hypothetical protein